MDQIGPRVLLVDDDPVALRALEDIYRANGMVPVSVSNGRAALAEASHQFPDLCVVDVFLPDVNGLQVIDEMRKRPELRRSAIIGITAHHEQSYLATAFASGGDDFLFKPIIADELIIRSRLAIQRRRTGAAAEPIGDLRKDLTALFCDVRGFTAMAARHDPEWVVQMLNALFDRLVGHLTVWGGQVDKFLGDGLLAFFGMGENGQTKELCAVQAALSMVQGMEDFSRESLLLEGRPLGVGVGIASGEVVIAAVGARDLRQVTAIGDAVNLASRLQSIAGEGEVLICERTYQRIAAQVVSEGAREVVLKGISGTPRVHPVLGLRPDGWLG